MLRDVLSAKHKAGLWAWGKKRAGNSEVPLLSFGARKEQKDPEKSLFLEWMLVLWILWLSWHSTADRRQAGSAHSVCK